MGKGKKRAKVCLNQSISMYVHEIFLIKKMNKKNQNVKRCEDPKHTDVDIHGKGGFMGGRAKILVQHQAILGLECQA